jgi:hypothetical protein
MYIYVYGFISNIFLLYYWISVISLYIYLLYLLSHFMSKIIRIIIPPLICLPLSLFPPHSNILTLYLSSLSTSLSLAHSNTLTLYFPSLSSLPPSHTLAHTLSIPPLCLPHSPSHTLTHSLSTSPLCLPLSPSTLSHT